jgi:replicative DNA helicase
MRQLAHSSFAAIERAHERKQLITGVPSGFTDLDEITAGFQAGDLVIIAARPSVGKTALVLNIAQHVRERKQDGRSASSAWKCRRSSCSFACSLPRRASTATGCARDFSWKATGAGCRTRWERERGEGVHRRHAGIGVLEMRAKSRA